jgi:hypothetical protein
MLAVPKLLYAPKLFFFLLMNGFTQRRKEDKLQSLQFQFSP